MKTIRVLRVSYTHTKKQNPTPFLRLAGYWLNDAGFKVGDKVTVIVENNKLTIRKKEN